MDWIKTFYAQQTRWVPEVYLGDVTEHHRTRAAQLSASRGDELCILELGCGGGQFAAALADLGHHVTAIDLNSEALANARALAASRPNLTVVQGNFYTTNLQGPFDLICYIDGFGIGSDDEQRQLLCRFATWLTPLGEGLVDIYAPWHWARVAGKQMTFGDIVRQYDFDPRTSAMRDCWWHASNPEAAVTQILRCYTPADLKLLLEATPLTLTQITPGGGFDDEGRYAAQVELSRAMQYQAHLRLA